MSGDSRDFYHSSRSRTGDRSQTPNLPPIRQVVGDVLEQPARPTSGSSNVHRPSTSRNGYSSDAQSHYSSRGYHPATPGVHLPPIQSSRSTGSSRSTDSPRPTSASSSSYARGYQSYSSSSRHPPMQHQPLPRASTPGHSYDVFVSTSGQGLIHKRTSDKDDFHQVAKEDAISTSTGRHVCPECSRRFEKLSTLKNHMTTHSGARPYECPDCGKAFSVSSNMKRHQLTHRTPGVYGDKME